MSKKRNFVNDCLLFKSKDKLHRFLGIWFWFNFLVAILKIIVFVNSSKNG